MRDTGLASSLPDAPGSFVGPFSTAIEDRLAAAISTGPVSLCPQAVAGPSGLPDVVALVERARSEGWRLTPRGGATGMPGGNVGHGVAVDMRPGFRRIEEVDRGAMRMVAGAGVRMSDVAAAARSQGLDLPPLPSSADRCTLGGVLANNAAGARSFRHGSIAGWVRSVEAVLGNGDVVALGPSTPPPDAVARLRDALRSQETWKEGWPRVRKNSSGYALPRFGASGRASDLLVGSEGTLALLTRVELSLRTLPEARGLHRIALPTVELLSGVADVAGAAGAVACEFLGKRFLQLGEVATDPMVGELPRGTWGLALVEVEGTDQEVTEAMVQLSEGWARLGLSFQGSRSEEEMEAVWGIRRRASPTIARNAGPALRSVQFIEDSVVPPEHLTAYVEGVDGILREASLDAVIFGHAGDANVHVNPLVPLGEPGARDRCRDVLRSVAELVKGLGGTLTGEHGDGRIRAPFLETIWSEEAVAAFRHVKATLDPDGILNPGVVLPIGEQDPLEGFGEQLTPGAS